jgi:carbamoyltransferase
MSKKIYIGLNDNFHDPSICILDEKGNLLFTEGIERYLQSKRGIGCPPDMDFYFEKIIESLFPKDKYHVYVASSWTKKRHLFYKYLDFVGILNYDSNSLFRKLFKRLGAHRSFHSGSLRAAAALCQSGAGIFKQFNKWNLDSVVERKYYNHHLTHIVNSISCSDISAGIGLV